MCSCFFKYRELIYLDTDLQIILFVLTLEKLIFISIYLNEIRRWFGQVSKSHVCIHFCNAFNRMRPGGGG